MTLTDILTPHVFASELNKGRTVETIVKELCSRSRGYQILNRYKEDYPELFPPKPVLTPEKLKEEILSKTLCEIASDYQISINTLKKKMVEWEVRKMPLKDRISKETLETGVEKGVTDEEFASLFHCSVHTIMKLRYEHHIYRQKNR